MKKVIVEIDKKSGFCHGVIRAIKKAEQELADSKELFCLGQIVHNSEEVARLERIGLRTIDYEQFKQLKNTKVLFRAHGEPPEIYDIARKNNVEIIDASCAVVLNLQKRIKEAHTRFPEAQIVILGKRGHAEVVGLEGQIEYSAVVVESVADIDKIDFSKQIILFSQTTKSIEEFRAIIDEINLRKGEGVAFQSYDTICRQVSNRIPELREFASMFDAIIFASGKNSSNGKVLFEVCRLVNPNTVFVSSLSDLRLEDLKNAKSIGICGATSTPIWFMEQLKETIENYFNA